MDKMKMNLQLFAEGGAGSAAGSDGGQAAAAGAQNQAEKSPVARGRRRENPLANVVYGRQEQPQVAPAEAALEGAAQQEAASGELAAEQTAQEDFESLINGRYKADFERRVQGIVRDRLKGSHERENRVNPILEMVAQRYGMDASDMSKLDLNALAEKIAGDTSQYEQEAMEKGLPVETVAKLHQLERMEQQQARDKQKQEMQQKFLEEQRRMQGHFENLQRQAEEVKKIYPGFDLDRELENRTFLEMTKPGSNVDVLAAYRAIHHDELAGAEMKFAAQKSAQRISASVAANGRRPVENGMNGSAGATSKVDPSSLSKADFNEIRKRVKRGEKIVF